MPPLLMPSPPDTAELPGSHGIDTGMQVASTPSAMRAIAPPPSKDDPVFDRWLRNELGRLHNDVLQEPVPDRLLQIIQGTDDRN
jgi:hypothetical protein